MHLWKVEQTKKKNICNANPKWKEVNLLLLTDTMHSAKDKHFRSFRIGTEVLSFADSTLFIAVPSQLLKLLVLQYA
jgi:hypothetical protein